MSRWKKHRNRHKILKSDDVFIFRYLTRFSQGERRVRAEPGFMNAFPVSSDLCCYTVRGIPFFDKIGNCVCELRAYGVGAEEMIRRIPDWHMWDMELWYTARLYGGQYQNNIYLAYNTRLKELCRNKATIYYDIMTDTLPGVPWQKSARRCVKQPVTVWPG